MNIEEIKVGETYYVRVKVTATAENRFVCRPLLWGCTMSDFAPNFFNFAEAEAFYKSIPEQPKHDPCRLFKKGDIVEMDTHGRDIAASMKKSGVELGKRYTVTEDENNTGYVSFIGEDGIEHHSMFFWLKLVTPVEELEPYELVETTDYWSVEKENKELCLFWKKHHHNAKKAAEDERDRLNAEWRKEQANA